MNTQNVKKRAWVKDAAIAFLAVMLVLTFFSNTIMNRSLPEVAAQYAMSGAITTRIRGTGSVTPNEVFEVKLKQSRTVQSVPVKVGDRVSVGDVLVVLKAGDSDELEQLEDELESLRYDYNRAVIEATDSTAARSDRDIQNAREALEEAQKEADKLKIDEKEVEMARIRSEDAQTEVDEATEAVQDAQAELDALGGKQEGSSGDSSGLNAAQRALDDAKRELDALMLIYGEDYAEMRAYAEQHRGTSTLEVYMYMLYLKYGGTAVTEPEGAAESEPPVPDAGDVDSATMKVWCEAYEKIRAAEDAVNDAQTAYDRAVDTYYDGVSSGNASKWNRLSKALKAAQNELTAATRTLNTAKSEYDRLNNRLTEYKTAEANLKTCENALEDLLFNRQDSDTQSKLEALALQKQLSDIAELEQKVSELRGDGESSEVLSDVNGIVSTISVSAGSTAEADSALIAVEVPDRGYSVSFSVTNDQARRVSIGDSAEVSNGWWGTPDISAVLSSIRADKDNPSQNRKLVFDVSGEDVESGAQLSLSIGQRSQNYEVTVPNSAVRNDTNGDFVLVVESKSSPLGNRYVAKRVDVTVIASDDSNTAITGGVTTSDFVITTSTKPIESGDQVRLPD